MIKLDKNGNKIDLSLMENTIIFLGEVKPDSVTKFTLYEGHEYLLNINNSYKVSGLFYIRTGKFGNLNLGVIEIVKSSYFNVEMTEQNVISITAGNANGHAFLIPLIF